MSEVCVWGVLVSLSLINSSFQVLTNIDVTCPLDWVQHPNYKNNCYRLGGSAVPYSSAPGGCQGLQNGSTVANIYNLEIHNFLIDGFLSPNHEYYTSLRSVGGEYVFTELNNEPLEDWNEWGTITGDTCTVYSNVGGIWFWHTNNCNQPCLYICEYIVPTPGVLPVVLIPVDSIPLSGRVEVFQPSMWGTLRDSGSKETVTIVCKDLGLLYDSGLQCTGADDCGTGRVWNEKVKCDVNSANMLDCLADAKPTSPKDHSKDTIARCKAQETTTSEVLTTVETTAIENNITTLEVHMSTFGDITTHDEETTAIVTTEPITPQTNVTIDYHNFTHTVNVTVTEIITSYVTIVSSSTCLSVPSTSESLAYTTTSSTVESSTTAHPTTPHVPYVYEALPVVKAKNTAKYSTKTRQDYRPSAQVLGSFGILIIVTILSVIVALDLGTLGKATIRFCKKKNPHRNDSQGECHERNSESDADSTFSTPRSLTNISINALAMMTYVKRKPSKTICNP